LSTEQRVRHVPSSQLIVDGNLVAGPSPFVLILYDSDQLQRILCDVGVIWWWSDRIIGPDLPQQISTTLPVLVDQATLTEPNAYPIGFEKGYFILNIFNIEWL
jgi:hypothetical protein